MHVKQLGLSCFICCGNFQVRGSALIGWFGCTGIGAQSLGQALTPLAPVPLQLLLLVAVWFALWLLRPHALSPHFKHCRLRLRGALPLLMRYRRTWAAATGITTLDAFANAFLISVIYRLKARQLGQHAPATCNAFEHLRTCRPITHHIMMNRWQYVIIAGLFSSASPFSLPEPSLLTLSTGQARHTCALVAEARTHAHTQICTTHPPWMQFSSNTQWYLLAYAITCLAASVAVGVLLMARLGRRLGLRLMYGLAALPGVVVVQASCWEH